MKYSSVWSIMCLPQCDQTNVAMLAKEKINNQIFKLNEIAKVQQIIQNLKSTLKITVFVCIYIGMKGLFCNTIPFQISTVEATNIFGQKHGPGTF